MTPTRVLFVCSGNRYRSPIAERLLRAHLGPHAERFQVGSAGTVARPGTALGPGAADVIAELGGSTESFASRRLTAALVEAADVVLGLTREHRESAVRLYPGALRRCFTLEEFVRLSATTVDADPAQVVRQAAADRGRLAPTPPGADDIADPQGLPADAVHWCAVRIDQAVRRVAAVLTAAGVRTGA
jgi:protein-tyrosine phosphatase